jgi:hypothetical protein
LCKTEPPSNESIPALKKAWQRWKYYLCEREGPPNGLARSGEVARAIGQALKRIDRDAAEQACVPMGI